METMKKLPCDECGGKCCTFPAFTRKEFETVKAKHGIPFYAQYFEADNVVVFKETCPYLKSGKCSIYDDRPQNCKVYGTKAGPPCMYLYPVEAALQVNASAEALIRRYGP